MNLVCPAGHGALSASAGEARCGACAREWQLHGGIWSEPGLAPPERFDAAAAGRLADLRDHFWVRGRTERLTRILATFPRGEAAVDLGCGTGELLPSLARRYERVTGVDGWVRLLEAAAEKGCAELLAADVRSVPLPGGEFDLVVACDVLEHVEPDPFLREARRLVRDGGRLLLTVPAFPFLYGEVDRRAGHRVRYRRRMLARELSRNGFRPLGFTHFQFLLFPLVVASRALGAGTPGGPERRPSPLLARALLAVNSLETALFGARSLPFGSTLVSWAEAA